MQASISASSYRGNRLHVPAGLLAARGAGGCARRWGGCGGAGKNGVVLSGNAGGLAAEGRIAEEVGLQNV